MTASSQTDRLVVKVVKKLIRTIDWEAYWVPPGGETCRMLPIYLI